MIDVLFVCDATPASGFGHAARCALIAASIRGTRPNFSIGFRGAFTDRAIEFIQARIPDVVILPADSVMRSGVSIVDRMADPDDVDAWDARLLERLRGQSRHVIHIASGTTPPDMPGDVTVVGYQPIEHAPDRPNTHWGPKFAPVEGTADEGTPGRPDAAFVAIGGGDSARCLALVLETIAAMDRFTLARILVSPVWDESAIAAAVSDYPGMAVERLENLPDLTAKIRDSAVVIATQGNLAYQAIALRRPTVLVAIKDFQADIARRLEAAGLCRFAGLAEGLGAAHLGGAIEEALGAATAMARAAAGKLDGKGIERLATLILSRYEHVRARS